MNINDYGYVFYSIFVENEKSSKYVCLLHGDFFVTKDPTTRCERVFGLIPYERVLDHIDLTEALLKQSIIITREDPDADTYKGYLIEKSTKLCLQDIAGYTIHLLKSECEEVKKKERIAYIITGKLETRNVFSLCEGRIIFVVDMVWETPRRVLLAVVPGELGEITIRKSSRGCS